MALPGFSREEPCPLWSTVSFPLQISKNSNASKTQAEPSLPPASRSPHHRLLHQTAPLAATPQRRGLCSADSTVSLDACSEGRRRKKKKKCFCCDKCQLCLCLKRTVVLPNGTLSNVQKPYIEVRRLPRSEIVWLPWGRGRGRITGKPLLWMFGHTTQGSGEKLAAPGSSLRPGPCSFLQERLETHALAHEARLPDHF